MALLDSLLELGIANCRQIATLVGIAPFLSIEVLILKGVKLPKVDLC
jgi:hypothetical protein